MKKFAIALVCCCVAPANATTLLYEGFNPRSPDTCPAATCHGYNYADGEQLAYSPDPDAGVPNGQYNQQYNQYWRFATAGTSQAPGITGGSLSVTGLPASVGNMAQVFMNTSTPHLARTEQLGTTLTDGNSLYWSGILRITNVDAWTTTNIAVGGGAFLMGLSNTAGASTTTPSTFQGFVAVSRSTANPNQYFLATGTTNNGSTFDTSVALNDGDSVFVVVAYDKIAGTNADRARLWINPNSSTFGASSPPTPNVNDGFVGGTQRTPISFFLRNSAQGTTGDRPLVQFDELRVATTWAEATGATIAPNPLGDFNNDGKVDAADYVSWRKNDGTNNALPNDNGLGTPIGQNHYNLWRANYGSGVSGSGSSLGGLAVPEPGTVGLLIVGILLAFGRGKRF
jgi:hypothetical protein